jgi:hypothetical protein
VVGAFGVFGALGILVASSVGGQLFDKWDRSGPFVLMGVLNGLVLVWALVVRAKGSSVVSDPDARGEFQASV